MKYFDYVVLPTFSYDMGRRTCLDEQHEHAEPYTPRGAFLSTTIGAGLGVLVGAGFIYRVLSNPAAASLIVTPIALAVIALSTLGYLLSRTYGWGMDNTNCERPWLTSCAKIGAIGAAAGMFVGSGLALAACFSPSFATAILPFFGASATQLQFAFAAGSVIAFSIFGLGAVCAICAIIVSLFNSRQETEVERLGQATPSPADSALSDDDSWENVEFNHS